MWVSLPPALSLNTTNRNQKYAPVCGQRRPLSGAAVCLCVSSRYCVETAERIEITFGIELTPNFVQIRPRGLVGEWVKYNEIFHLFIYFYLIAVCCQWREASYARPVTCGRGVSYTALEGNSDFSTNNDTTFCEFVPNS